MIKFTKAIVEIPWPEHEQGQPPALEIHISASGKRAQSHAYFIKTEREIHEHGENVPEAFRSLALKCEVMAKMLRDFANSDEANIEVAWKGKKE